MGDASVQQKTNVSSLFETTTTTTTTTTTQGKKDDEKEEEENELDENKLPPSHTAEDILGAEGISETDLYRFLEDLDEMAPTIPDQYTNSVLKTVGVGEPDVRVTRLISLAAQKFMQQIADDCFKVQANKLAALPKDEKAEEDKPTRRVDDGDVGRGVERIRGEHEETEFVCRERGRRGNGRRGGGDTRRRGRWWRWERVKERE